MIKLSDFLDLFRRPKYLVKFFAKDMEHSYNGSMVVKFNYSMLFEDNLEKALARDIKDYIKKDEGIELIYIAILEIINLRKN